ncbi:signal peptidase II [Magnetococcales bacterium HHB-1]
MFATGLWIALGVIIADQISKLLTLYYLQNQVIPIIPNFLDFVLVHNVGAAFGLFTSMAPMPRTLLLVTVALGATGLILHLLKNSQILWTTFALGCILGGALGNLIDRLRLGAVVDFIHLHWYEYSWPVFNVADSAITIGIGMLLWESVRYPDPTPPPQS